MSAFNNGGTFSATTKPAALLEIAKRLSDIETANSTPDVPLNNVTITFDLEANTAAIAATLPIQPTISPSGQIVISAVNYIGPGGSYQPGANGDLHTAHWPGLFLEVAQLVGGAEKAVTVNQPNNVTIAMDLEGQTATVTAALPISATISANGSLNVAAADYLPDEIPA